MDLKELGFTKAELQQRVIDRACEILLSSSGVDGDGDEWTGDSKFKKMLEARIAKQIDDTINALAEKHILPNVAKYIEEITLQETNQWGEKKGVKTTFIEYLTQRAEHYLTEEVDYEGKNKAESRSSYWQKSQTRIAHMIHQHLHYSIESAMKEAMKSATGQIAKGIQETVKIKLGEIAEKLETKVTTR